MDRQVLLVAHHPKPYKHSLACKASTTRADIYVFNVKCSPCHPQGENHCHVSSSAGMPGGGRQTGALHQWVGAAEEGRPAIPTVREGEEERGSIPFKAAPGGQIRAGDVKAAVCPAGRNTEENAKCVDCVTIICLKTLQVSFAQWFLLGGIDVLATPPVFFSSF